MIKLDNLLNFGNSFDYCTEFLLIFSDEGFQSELYVMELDWDESIHKVVNFVNFWVDQLLLILWAIGDYLDFLFQIGNSYPNEIIILSSWMEVFRWISGMSRRASWALRVVWVGGGFGGFSEDYVELELSDELILCLYLLLVL